MANQPESSGPRWWRRSRDLALLAARSAHADARQAMVHLESLEVDLTELSAIDAASHAHRAGAERVGFRSPLSDQWDELSVRTGIPALEFYELDAAYDPAADYEEAQARRYTQRLTAVAGRLRELLPEVEAFRQRNAAALDAALALREAVPELVSAAAATLKEAGLALAAAANAGLEDPTAREAHGRSTADLASARTAADERRWVGAHDAATRAGRDARTARDLARSLDERASQVRNGFLSVRTRRDALRNQQPRLDETMSQLRRRYTLPTWQHVEAAPATVASTLRRVDEDLTSLEGLFAARPLVVPAAAELLGSIRVAITGADRELRAAVGLFERLDAISGDPQRMLDDLQRRLVDTRRFVTGRPAAEAARMSPTLDKLAARAEALRQAVAQSRPDWGAVMNESESIRESLDAMIRNARNV